MKEADTTHIHTQTGKLMGTQERRREGEGETKKGVQRDNAEEMGEKDATRARADAKEEGRSRTLYTN